MLCCRSRLQYGGEVSRSTERDRPHGQAYNTRTNSTEYPIWGKDHISSRWYFDSPEQAGVRV